MCFKKFKWTFKQIFDQNWRWLLDLVSLIEETTYAKPFPYMFGLPFAIENKTISFSVDASSVELMTSRSRRVGVAPSLTWKPPYQMPQGRRNYETLQLQVICTLSTRFFQHCNCMKKHHPIDPNDLNSKLPSHFGLIPLCFNCGSWMLGTICAHKCCEEFRSGKAQNVGATFGILQFTDSGSIFIVESSS